MIWVGSYTSVIGNNVVNTVRVTRSYENAAGASPAWYDLNGHVSRDGQMRNLAPGYRMSSFWDNIARRGRAAASTRSGSTTTPRRGSSPTRWGTTTSSSAARSTGRSSTTSRENFLGGAFHFNTDLPFDINDYSTYPERLQIRVGAPTGNHFAYPINTWEDVLPGQVDAERALDPGARRAVGRRDAERGADRQPADGAGDRSARLEQHLAAALGGLRRDGRRPAPFCGRATGTFMTGRCSAGSTTSCRIRSSTTPSSPPSPAAGASRADRRIPGRRPACRSRTPS